jgi:hypothetical protein
MIIPADADNSASPEIGSSNWWGAAADKLLNFGLNTLSTQLNTATPAKTALSNPSVSITTNSFQKALPWIAGGLAAVGIVVILAKR